MRAQKRGRTRAHPPIYPIFTRTIRHFPDCGRFSSCSPFIAQHVQNEHTDEQQDKGRAKAPPQISLGKSGDNVTDEAAKSHDARITQLCRYVFDMITSGTGTGENGRIRNGGAMITEHAASEGCGKGNHHEIRIDGLSHRDDDRDQDAEGPPCRARGEAQKPAIKNTMAGRNAPDTPPSATRDCTKIGV